MDDNAIGAQEGGSDAVEITKIVVEATAGLLEEPDHLGGFMDVFRQDPCLLAIIAVVLISACLVAIGFRQLGKMQAVHVTQFNKLLEMRLRNDPD